MPIVYFIDKERSIEVPEGTTILDAARKSKVILETPCNQMGTCGKCKVQIPISHLECVIQDEGRHKVSEEDREKGMVLSCQTKVYGDIHVKLIKQNKNKSLKIMSEGQSFPFAIKNNITKNYDGENTFVYAQEELIGKENGDTTKFNYGLAVDIGTTTLVAELVDVESGKVLSSVSTLNPQSLTAQDVLSRIQFASKEEGLDQMYHDITDQINAMISDLEEEAGISHGWIYEVIYSGNTTMIHLATKVSPAALGKYPYTPAIYGGNSISAKENGIEVSPFGLIYLPPIISAYVGPDITSGILVSQLDKKTGTTLFIDIGTNGEMVIAKDGSLFATSTAAGPAFEGMNISYGMRAGEGAIEFFEINEDNSITVKTIGESVPVGICGSGLLDIVGELVRVGVIAGNGKLLTADKGCFAPEIATRLISKDGKPCFEIADNVYLTQKDIRQVQLAKGAIRSGVEALLDSQNISAAQVDSVEIAGSFGYHLRAKSLINIGLLPEEFADKVSFVGNTSKTGAIAFLLNKDFREQFKETVKNIGVVELANKDGFEKLFVKSLSFSER